MAGVSLIVPTLNERGSIERLLLGLANVFVGYEGSEIIVVDDGSTDGTVAAIHALSIPVTVRVIERTERGLATAVLTGFRAAKNDILGVMDADLSHPPDLVPALLAALANADIALGSRHIAGGRVEHWPQYRVLASRAATVLTRPLGVRVRDPMSGFFFLRRAVIDGVTLSPVGYKILLEILVKGRYKNVAEVPYTFRNRDVGKSKMDAKEGFRYLRHLGRLYRSKFSL